MAAPTSADVARRANVSRATVSYVLNRVSTQKISAKTRDAVHRAAQELGYRPNLAAQSLAAGASNVAMFVIPSVHLGELAVVVSSYLTAHAAEQGLNLVVHFEASGNRAVVEVARDLRPRIVLSMFPLDDETLRWLDDNDVKSASTFPGVGMPALVPDNVGQVQVEHLIERGHTRIAFADTSDPDLEILARTRHDQVVKACRDYGLDEPAYAEISLRGQDSDAAVQRWVSDGVTAVAAYNDEVAITVLAGIRRAGLVCPSDLAVMGVDEMSTNESMEPPLTSIEFDMDSMAKFYAKSLSNALFDNDAQPQRTADVRGFMRVVSRASTAARPARR